MIATIIKTVLLCAIVPAVLHADDNWRQEELFWKKTGEGVTGISGYVGDWALYAPGTPVSELEIERKVTLREPLSDSWIGAGIGVYLDDDNYWLLDLARDPERMGARRSAGLHRMFRGQWHSEGALTRRDSAAARPEFSWEYGRPYRLRLRLGNRIIRGEVRSEDGTLLWADEYEFPSQGADCGVPGMYVQYCRADFSGPVPRIGEKAVLSKNAPCEEIIPIPGAEYSKTGKTGFFRVERGTGETRYLVDPSGRRFYAIGVDHVNFYKHFCEKIGYAPYHRQAALLYGTPERWAEYTLKRLKSWGFNCLGADSTEELRHHGLPHTESLALGTAFAVSAPLLERGNWTGFPDVFHPDWEAFCRAQARKKCAKWRDDPCLLGYFLDNELEYFGRAGGGDSAGLFRELMRQGRESHGKQALIAHLRKTHGSTGEFNRVWKTAITSFAQLETMTELPAVTEEARAVRERFLELLGERYFKVAAEAVRAADPNHLILGTRFAGNAPDWALRAAGKYCDVISFNQYPLFDLESSDLSGLRASLTAMHRRAGGNRPLMVTEWSVLGLDSGLPCRHGGGMRVDTQTRRTEACRALQQLFFELPFMVGSNYFMWADEPAPGISPVFPEDGNYGLVDRNDRPYPELTGMFAEWNPQVFRLHGRRPPASYAREAGPEPPKPEKPDASVDFRRLPNGGFYADNGVLRFEYDGKSGNFFDRISFNGNLMGFYNPLVRQLAGGRDRWVMTGGPVRAEVRKKDGVLELELTASGGGEDGAVKFEVTHLFRISPGTSHAEVELKRIRNLDTVPLTVKALYAAFYPSGPARPAEHPLLYYCKNGRIASWVDSRGRYLGMAAAGPRRYDDTDAQGAWKLHYYLGAGGEPHPDARLQLDPMAELAQGAEWKTDTGNRVFLFCADGNPEKSWYGKKGKK